ncbi:hypothetical protein BROUX41_001262 [Berkeleyomyces rouxiae]|uniref:uncharacterized protein n=1 Tax=Berkeleyomyces rouxiae TaxID=2035830 RepID=UPI003B7AE05B
MTSATTSAYAAIKNRTFSVTALSRWSILDRTLPNPDTIKAIHVYDFDNTLFRTPLPNLQIWGGPTVGSLCSNEFLSNGGWWHDSSILAATGQGADKEEARAWEGWWNEKIVELVQLSMQQTDALTVLLTGRSESAFASLVKRMVASKGLEFDLAGLKPRVSPTNETFPSTMRFKQMFLETLMFTYPGATELNIYEDRPKHVREFRDFFADFNHRMESFQEGSSSGLATSQKRQPIKAEVIQVGDAAVSLDPVVEVAEVQRMVNAHNKAVADGTHTGERLRIKRTVFFTSYGIDTNDATRLNKLANLQSQPGSSDIKFHGTNILICARPCPASVLNKIGGMGAKMTWRVVAVGHLNNSVWAAQVEPVPANATYHSDSPIPMVVLAVRKGIRPSDATRITNWTPIDEQDQFSFETRVVEKMNLRLEAEEEGEYDIPHRSRPGKRKYSVSANAGDDEGRYFDHNKYGSRGEGRFDPSGYRGGHGGYGESGQYRGRGRGGRGARGGGRGGAPFHGRGRGRGRGRGASQGA